MPAKHRLSIFASGSGSNFAAIAEAVAKGQIVAELVLLVCDQPSAQVIKRAEALGIPTLVLSLKDYPSKQAYEIAIVQALSDAQVSFIALAGYMKLIGETLLAVYEGRMVNLHPSLLPAYPGREGIRQAYDNGDTILGATVHYVDSGMDTGAIIAQDHLTRQSGESLEGITQRIHDLEHQLYTRVLADLLNKGRDAYG